MKKHNPLTDTIVPLIFGAILAFIIYSIPAIHTHLKPHKPTTHPSNTYQPQNPPPSTKPTTHKHPDIEIPRDEQPEP